MEFPQDIQNIINEYAKPCTRPDWKEGCYFSRQTQHYYHMKYNDFIYQSMIEFTYDFDTNYSNSFSDDDSEYSAFSDYENED